MSLFATLVLFVTGSTRQTALAWADRLYREAPEMSANLDPWYHAYGAYRQVEKVYGASEEISKRLATCCLRIGDLARVNQFVSKLTNQADPLIAQLKEKLTWKDLFQKRLPKEEHLLDLIRLDSGRMVVLSGTQGSGNEWEGFYKKVYNALFIRSLDLRVGRRLPPPFPVHLQVDAAFFGHLYRWKDPSGEETILVAYEGTAMNCEPGTFQLFRDDAGNLKHLRTLYAIYGIKGFATAGSLAIKIGEVYKRNWADFYDWDGQHLQFANDRHPGGFRSLNWFKSLAYGREERRDYCNWLEQAAMQCIWKRWNSAAMSLRQAERVCRLALSERARGVDSGGHHDFGHFGDTATNLKLIRQRLRWLAHRDYNHRLLYRPFDGDFQDRP